MHPLVTQSGVFVFFVRRLPTCQTNRANFTPAPSTTNADSNAPFIPEAVIMKPILDVRQQTCLGSFEPERQLLLQSPEPRSESSSHLSGMVRGERRREGERRSIRQLEAGFPLQWQRYFYLCVCVCVCTWMCHYHLHMNGVEGGREDLVQLHSR